MQFPRSTFDNDRGDVVLGWLTKLLVVTAIVGVTLIDAVSIVKAHYGAAGDAQLAASRASAVYATSRNVDEAYAAAAESVVDLDETIDKKTFSVDEQGTVQLTLRRVATTVVVDRIPPLRKFAVASSAGTAAAPAAAP